MDESTVQVQSTLRNPVDSQDLKLNAVVASFVTSYARIELLRGMEFVGPDRLLYVDTDCVMALESNVWPSLPTGKCLGVSKSEIGEEKIDVFICGGAKMYTVRIKEYRIPYE